MSWDEVVSKFRDCTYSLLPESDILRIVELVANLESVDKNIDRLSKIISDFGVMPETDSAKTKVGAS